MVNSNHFLGNWVLASPSDTSDWRVFFDISMEGASFCVSARSCQDGEEYEISELRFHRQALQFVSVMPSTNWKCLNKLRLKSANRIEIEYTCSVVEELSRITPSTNPTRPELDSGNFVGSWVALDPLESTDYLIEYSIVQSRGVLAVSARDYRDGEILRVSKARFDGKVLEFVAVVPSTGRRGVCRFQLKGADRVESKFQFTFVEEMTRLHDVKTRLSKIRGSRKGA